MQGKSMKGLLIDISYRSDDDQTVTRLYIRTAKGVKLIEDREFDPYFYLITKDPREALKIEGVKEVQVHDKNMLKVLCKTPADVPKVREKAKLYGQIREYDIPFVQRYLMDHDIKPMKMYEWDGIKHEPIEGSVKLKSVALDFETYNPKRFSIAEKDPILIAGTYDGTKAQLFSWKDLHHKNVEVVENEKEMAEAFVESMKGADIVYTYNGDNFDLPYLQERRKKLKIKDGLGFEGKPTRFRNAQRGGVSARIPGKAHIDAYQGVSFIARIGGLKLPRYTLEDVYKELTGKEKVDIESSDIWRVWDEGSEKELKEFAQYNQEDCEAAWEIGEYVRPLYTELAKLVGVTVTEATHMSTGQMVELLLLKKSFGRGVIAPNKPGKHELAARAQKPIEGGYVKTPDTGLHDNVAILDFRGLYPSIIISHNISPETLDCKCCKDAHESPQGHRFCKKHKGLIPEMLGELITRRVDVKKRMKEAEGTAKKRLHAEQWALKIIANSTYGYMLYNRARWYSRACGESITAWARHYVQNLISKAEDAGFKVIYGDSVTGERFVTVLNPKGIVETKNIEALFNENEDKAIWRRPKHVINLKGWKALTANPKSQKPCWAPIKQIIRHKAKKRILRVNQKHGETRVTEDHSLIVKDNNELISVKAEELKDAELARVESVPAVKKISTIDVYEAMKGITYETVYKGRKKVVKAHKDGDWVWFGWTNQKKRVKAKRIIRVGTKDFGAMCRLLGAYIAEGSASTRETSKAKWGASIASSDKAWLLGLQKDYHRLFRNVQTCVIRSNKKRRTIKTQGKTITYDDTTNKLQMMNEVSAIFFKAFCGQTSKNKALPSFIYHVDDKHKMTMLKKMIEGDGSRKENDERYTEQYKKNNFTYHTSSLQLACGTSLLLTQLNQKHTIRHRPSKGAYSITTSSRYNSRIHTKLTEEEYSGYVYDLSVEGSHMFVDSCGQILLHNTDSAFLKLGKKKKADVLAFVKEYNSGLPGAMEVEFEGYYPRCIFVTKKEGGAAKKRYALLREDGQVEITGLEFVRRDWSAIAKKTQREVVKLVLEDKVDAAKKVVLDTIDRVRKNKVPIEDLVIYTQLKRKIEKYESIGPHVKAAMRLRDSGEEVYTGMTISYVVTKGAGSIGDRSWPLSLVGNRVPDAEYYLDHQVLPAVMKILNELDIEEDELKHGSKQTGLGAWS